MPARATSSSATPTARSPTSTTSSPPAARRLRAVRLLRRHLAQRRPLRPPRPLLPAAGRRTSETAAVIAELVAPRLRASQLLLSHDTCTKRRCCATAATATATCCARSSRSCAGRACPRRPGAAHRRQRAARRALGRADRVVSRRRPGRRAGRAPTEQQHAVARGQQAVQARRRGEGVRRALGQEQLLQAGVRQHVGRRPLLDRQRRRVAGVAGERDLQRRAARAQQVRLAEDAVGRDDGVAVEARGERPGAGGRGVVRRRGQLDAADGRRAAGAHLEDRGALGARVDGVASRRASPRARRACRSAPVGSAWGWRGRPPRPRRWPGRGA